MSGARKNSGKKSSNNSKKKVASKPKSQGAKPAAAKRSVKKAPVAATGLWGRVTAFGQRLRRWRLLMAFLALMGIVALVAAGAAIYKVWQQPDPEALTVDVRAPGVTSYAEEGRLYPDPVYIDFGGGDDSAANLELVDKEVKEGIKISPPVAGTWRWAGDRRLVFSPDNDWAADTEYTVELTRSVFGPKVKIADTSPSFRTPQFESTIQSFTFYQDPRDAKINRLEATLEFTHPVDKVSLEEGLRLSGKKGSLDFTVDYDEHARRAYVHSENLTIPGEEYEVELMVPYEVKTTLGGADLYSPQFGKTWVPSVDTFFRIESANARIMRNEEKDNQPEQILFLEFTSGVEVEDLARHLEVYLLPRSYGLEGEVPKQVSWSDPTDVTERVLQHSEKLPTTLLPREEAFASNHSVLFDVPESESRYLFVRVKQGLASQGGYVMAKPYETILAAPDYPQDVKISQDGAVLPLSGDKNLSFLTRGVPGLSVTVGRLVAGQVNHLITQTYGNFENPEFRNWTFREDNVTERFVEKRTLNPTHPQKPVYASVDLAPHLAGRRGIFLVEAQAWNPQYNNTFGEVDKRLVVVTDIGLLVKDNADGSREVFAMSTASGQPMDGVRVEVLGKNGLPVLTRMTDANGHASFPVFKGLDHGKTPVAFVATKGEDISFLPVDSYDRTLNLSRFDVGGVWETENADSLSAYIFSDRGIYRPGETARLGNIVRRQDWQGLDSLPLRWIIQDSRGQRVVNKIVRLPLTGLFDQSYAVPETAPTGTYTAEIRLLGESGQEEYGQLLGSATFRVEEFQPDRMKIKTRIDAGDYAGTGWVNPEVLTAPIMAKVALANLFGTPAQNRRVTAEIELVPSNFYFKPYKDYRFTDPYRRPEQPLKRVTETLPEQKTNAAGEAEFPLDLSAYEAGTYTLSVVTQGYEAEGGRSVTGMDKVLISPLSTLVGYKLDGDTRYIKKGGRRTASLIAIDQKLATVALDGLTLSLQEKRQVSSLVKQKNGTYQYQSITQTKQVWEQPFNIAEAGSELQLPTDMPGEFYVQLSNADGLALMRLDYSVIGEGNLTGARERDAELQLKLNKSEYSAGDTIEMQITAPYTGAGLITIERDKVYAYQWFKADATNTVQRIQVPADFEGNGYINVSFVRAMDSREVFMSPLSYAVAPFTVDRDQREVQVELEVLDQIEPGYDLTVHYKTSRPANIILFGVDEGILQVAKYDTPDPLGHFFRKKALAVTTRQILDLIMPQVSILRQLSATGGDQSQKLLQKNLNPFKRKGLPPVVFWSGVLEASEEGGTFVYPVPDYFNGTLRVMAVAVAPQAMGAASKPVISQAPLILTPNVPLHVAPGDEFEVSVGVANNVEGSGDQAQMGLELIASDHLEILSDAKQTLTIAEKGEGAATFRVRALQDVGPTSLYFQARLAQGRAERTASYEASLSVRPAMPYRTYLQTGVTSKTKTTLDDVNRNMYSELAQRQAFASPNPLVLMEGLAGYLEAFPHGCTEQITSQVFPFLGLAQGNVQMADYGKVQASFARVVDMLRQRQTPAGGFALWPGQTTVSPFPSLYAAHMLTEAAAAGYAVPSDLQGPLMQWLQEFAADEDQEDLALQAYAAYLLTRNGHVVTSQLVRIEEALTTQIDAVNKPKDLTRVYLAAAYQVLQDDTRAANLIDAYRLGEQKDITYRYSYDGQVERDAQYLMVLARHFPGRWQQLQPAQVLEFLAPLQAGDVNTLVASYTIQALAAYQSQLENSLNGVSMAEQVDGDMRPLKVETTPFPTATYSPEAKAIRFEAAQVGKLGLFYGVRTSGFDRDLPTKSAIQGLEIQREFVDAEGKKLARVRQGDEFIVQLRVRAAGGKRDLVPQVAIIDLLPGGFEIVSAERVTGNYDHHEFREDRALFYLDVRNSLSTLTYRVKATAPGTFTVPPAYAVDMYDDDTYGQSAGGKLEVLAVE